MSGAEKLKEKIINEAKEQADHILKEAQDRAAQILAKGAQEALDKKKAILKQSQAEAEEKRRRILTIAALEARKRVLAVKEELIEETLQKALERLQNIEAASYQEMLLSLLLATVQSGREEIIVSPHDREQHFNKDFLTKVNQALLQQGKEGKLVLAEETRPLQGGFILRVGNVEINNSFNSVLHMKRDLLEPEVADILFREGV